MAVQWSGGGKPWGDSEPLKEMMFRKVEQKLLSRLRFKGGVYEIDIVQFRFGNY